jgi:hypothetical protein
VGSCAGSLQLRLRRETDSLMHIIAILHLALADERDREEAVAPPPSLDLLRSASSQLRVIALSGGGCILVLFYGNASCFVVSISGSTFDLCVVDVSCIAIVRLGNGYGGAVSVYFGLSDGLRQLVVSLFNLAVYINVLTGCDVKVSPGLAGNAYGRGVSVYVGG